MPDDKKQDGCAALIGWRVVRPVTPGQVASEWPIYCGQTSGHGVQHYCTKCNRIRAASNIVHDAPEKP